MDDVWEQVAQALDQVGELTVTGFGTFRVKAYAAFSGVDPETKKQVEVPAHRGVLFRQDRELNDLLQGGSVPSFTVAAEGYRPTPEVQASLSQTLGPALKAALADGGAVSLGALGVVEVERKPREELVARADRRPVAAIPERTLLRFRPSESLKLRLNPPPTQA